MIRSQRKEVFWKKECVGRNGDLREPYGWMGMQSDWGDGVDGEVARLRMMADLLRYEGEM